MSTEPILINLRMYELLFMARASILVEKRWREMCDWLREHNIKYHTYWAFSSTGIYTPTEIKMNSNEDATAFKLKFGL